VGTYGALAADYINGRQNDIVFFWTCNNTFVNGDLSSFYDGQHSGAYVDAIRMTEGTHTPSIVVLFAPWSSYTYGNGTISQIELAALRATLVDDGIRLMANAETHPEDPYENYPPTFSIDIYFTDNTFFDLVYSSVDNLVSIRNGTWTGNIGSNGYPQISGFSDTIYWLEEGGYLSDFISDFYEAITTNVSYP
jgi:hypothetical protein